MKSIVLILAFFLNLYFGLYIAEKGWRNRTHRYFFIFACSTSLWSLVQLILTNLESTEMAVLAGRLAFAIGSYVICSFFSFMLVFPKENNILYIRILTSGSLVLGSLFAGLALLTNYIQRGVYQTPFGIKPLYGDGFKYFSFYALILMLSSLSVLLKKYVSSNDLIEKGQLRIVLYGMTLFTFLTIGTTISLPLMGYRQYSSLSSSFSIVVIGTIAYSIMKYRFIDQKIAAKKGFMNSIFAGLFLLFVLFAYAISQELLNINDHYMKIAVITLIAFISSFGYNMISKLISYIVEYVIFKGKYDYPKIMSRFSKSISDIMFLDELVKSTSEIIKNIFESTRCEILILPFSETLAISSDNNIKYHLSKMINYSVALEYIIKICHNDDIIKKLDLEILASKPNFKELKPLIDHLDSEVISILQSENANIGIISLGEKINRSTYSTDELNLLRSLSSQAAIAFTRAIHYQKNIDLKVQYENILRQMSNGVIVTDQANDLVYINSKAIEMLVIKNINVEKIALDHLPGEIKTLLPKTHFQDIELGNRELKIKLDGGRILPVNCSVSTLCGKDGEILGLITVLTDLTEIKKWEEKARQADKLASLGTLAAGMAHEIKNPLSFIKSFTQMVPENLHDPQFFLSNASIAEKQVNSINFIVEQLLHYAMPSSPCFQELVAQDVIGESLILLRKEFQSKNIEIKENYPDQPIKFSADSKQIKQVLLNLLLNAIHAMAESREGQIGISLTEGQITEGSFKLNTRRYFRDAVIIKISDSGKGIPAQFVPQVFDPFFTTKDKGSGLGLAVVYSIIKEHGGYIDLETDPAKGTTFILTFPKKQEPPVSALDAGVNYEVFDKSQLDQEHVKNGSYSFS